MQSSFNLEFMQREENNSNVRETLTANQRARAHLMGGTGKTQQGAAAAANDGSLLGACFRVLFCCVK